MVHQITKKHVALVLIIATAMAIASCKPAATATPVATIDVPTVTQTAPTQTSEPAAIRVNGDAVSVAEYEQELQRYQAGLTAAGVELPDGESQKTLVSDMFIDQLLLKQGAIAAGFNVTQDDLANRIDQLQNQLGSADALAAWKAANFYTDDTFRQALERNLYAAWMRDKLAGDTPATAEQVHLQQIRVLDEGIARGILAQLDAGTDFDELAQLYEPTTRGDLGWLPRGYLTQAALNDAAFSLETGAYSQVISTAVGFHILRVLERDPARPLSPDTLQFMQQQAITTWLAAQKSAASITLE